MGVLERQEVMPLERQEVMPLDDARDIPGEGAANPLDFSVYHSTVPGYLLLLTCLCSAIIMYITSGLHVCKCKRRTTNWNHPCTKLIKTYLRKMAIFHVFNSVVLRVLHSYVYLTDNEPEDGEGSVDCFKPFSYRTVLLGIYGTAVAVGLVRFMSTSFAQKDTAISKKGYEIYRPGIDNGPGDNMGFTTQSAGFRLVVSPLLAIGLGLGLVIGLLVFGAFSRTLPESMVEYKMCFFNLQQSGTEKAMFAELWRIFILLIQHILPVLTVLAVEHCHYMIFHMDFDPKSKVLGYYVVLHSPFVLVNLICTWSGWLAIALPAYFLIHSSGAFLMIFMMVYDFFDCFFLLILCILTEKKNKVLTA